MKNRDVEFDLNEKLDHFLQYLKPIDIEGQYKRLTNQLIENQTNDAFKLFSKLVQQSLYREALEVLKIQISMEKGHKKLKNYHQSIHLYSRYNKGIITKIIRKVNWKLEETKRLFMKFIILSYSVILKMAYGDQIWLIGERPHQAEDNGYAFYKYCREHYPKRKIFYVIEKNSKHASKIRKLGNLIDHSSLRHKAFLLAAQKYISAWTTNESLLPRAKKEFLKSFKSHVQSKTHICLQHGVIIHNISPYLQKEIYDVDAIIASTQSEKEIIKNTLGYKDDEVWVTGLARFDSLVGPKPKKEILLMPTWRRYLSNQEEVFFYYSEYFQHYRSLLKNKRLHELLEKHGYTLNFYLHNEMQKFEKMFFEETETIRFFNRDNAFVSDLLKSSSMLLTDYSSVSTDIVYMNKPVIYYQFDLYHNHHTEVEEIKYSDLGHVVKTEDEVISLLEKVLNSGINEDDLVTRNDEFFEHVDQQNCERIFNKIEQDL